MSSPSQSPHEAEGVEPAATTPDEHEQPAPPADEEGTAMNPDPDEDPNNMNYEFEVKEQDRWLPIANVARIMKTALPDNAKIAKEAKECMQECVSEFISFITSEASEKCQQEKRKTVNGEDILFAMTSLGFENYGEALKIYLARYRENLVTRGENQKPSTAGGAANANNSTAGQDYDGNHTAALGTAADSATDFAYTNASNEF